MPVLTTAGTSKLSEYTNQTFSIMELASNVTYFLTEWTYIANATDGMLSGIMPPVSCIQVNGTVTPDFDTVEAGLQ